VACAVLVALCLALTILIVGLARDRSAGPQSLAPLALGSPARPRPHLSDPAIPPTDTPGAMAPEGVHR
jgi:hypothetical protein